MHLVTFGDAQLPQNTHLLSYGLFVHRDPWSQYHKVVTISPMLHD